MTETYSSCSHAFPDCDYMMHSLRCLLPGPTVCPACGEVKLVMVEGLWRSPKWSCGACKEVSDVHPPVIENIMNTLRECGKCYWEKVKGKDNDNT